MLHSSTPDAEPYSISRVSNYSTATGQTGSVKSSAIKKPIVQPGITDSPEKVSKSANNVMESELLEFINDHDHGFEWMVTKVKQNVNLSKDIANYLKRRAAIEEEYGKNLLKLSASMSLHETDVVANRSFDVAWSKMRAVLEEFGKRRIDYARDTVETCNDLDNVHKDTDRSRRQIKESCAKFRKQLTEAENHLEKLKAKFDASTEELARVRNEERMKSYQREPPTKKHTFMGGMFGKREKTEEECWSRANHDRDALNQHIEHMSELKSEFMAKHQPFLIKSLKETGDESDMAIQAMMLKHINQFEETTIADAETLGPLEADSLKASFANIDHLQDLKSFINSCVARDPVPAVIKETPSETMMTFGQPLHILSMEEKNDVPKVIRICVEALQKFGMKTPGLYRASASPQRLQEMISTLDRRSKKLHLYEGDGQSDPITIADALKVFFVKLPEPLLTQVLQAQFLEASKIGGTKQRLLRVHELINELPDANYITLRYMCKHLLQVSKSGVEEGSTLASIFGPIFIGNNSGVDAIGLSHLSTILMETIFDNYNHIFD